MSYNLRKILIVLSVLLTLVNQVSASRISPNEMHSSCSVSAEIPTQMLSHRDKHTCMDGSADNKQSMHQRNSASAQSCCEQQCLCAMECHTSSALTLNTPLLAPIFVTLQTYPEVKISLTSQSLPPLYRPPISR